MGAWVLRHITRSCEVYPDPSDQNGVIVCSLCRCLHRSPQRLPPWELP